MRNQRGFTLIEVLVTMSLMGLVFGATISLFVSFHKNERVNRLQNETQDQAHQAIDQMTRQMRNLASPRDFEPKAVELATDYDLVFKTIDPVKPGGTLNDRNIKRVRYCLSPASSGTSKLYSQQQTWTAPDPPPSFPSTAQCPSGAWGNQRVVVQDVVNLDKAEPVFNYLPSATVLDDIRSVQTRIWTDVNPGKSPAPTRLASGVFLRNQNRAPIPSCTATYAGNNQIVLNGSASEDPEGRTLREYEWLKSGVAFTPALKGVVGRWVAPGAGTYSFSIKVKDYGGLTAVANCNQSVVVP